MDFSLGRLVDLAAQLEQDAARAPDWLRRRDRALGRELGEGLGSPEQRVVAWLDRVRPEGDGPGERAERAGRVLGVLLVGLGLVLGSGAALAFFWYDGSHPVNVVRVLGFFVGLQLGMVGATVVLCLPEGWRRFLPGLRALQETLSLLSPGRWQGILRRILPGPQQQAMERLAGLARRHHRLYGDVEKWWLLSRSQSFGVAFHVAALATALALVLFSDLAFGWSTTLDVAAPELHAVTHALSRPWAALWPAAVPTPELVEATRYFRETAHHDPAASAPWWPFLLACMSVYGLAPRVALLGFAHWRMRAATRRAFRAIPGLAALRDRLSSHLVETAGEGEEPRGSGAAAAGSVGSAGGGPSLDPGVRCRAVVWSGFPLADAEAASAALGVTVEGLYRAGEADLRQDAEAIRALAEAGGSEPVVVVAKAWEPPVLELLDFLGELRAALGRERAIVVVPLALDAGGRPAAPGAEDARQWRRAADRLGDPWTSVHALERS
jgi:hypothetical protein